MEKKHLLTKWLAALGMGLVWAPLVVPILLTIVLFIQEGRFLLDFLMPAELFLLALVGGLLLLWAAWRARARWGLFGWGLGLAIAFLWGGQLLAEVTGLASGEMQPRGFWWLLVLASLALYVLMLVLLGLGGARLLRALHRNP
jgi:hypothetical protein